MNFHRTVGSIQPGPPAVGDVLASQRREVAKAVGQLQGLRVEHPEGGGGPVGAVNVGSVDGTVIVRSGGSETAWESVQYRAPEVVHGTSGWLRFDGSDIYVSPGWYHPVLLLWLRWNPGDKPTSADAYMGGGQDWAHQNPSTIVSPPDDSGFNHALDYGPTYMTGDDYLRAEVQFTPTAGPLLAGAYHNWTITKLS